MFVGTVVVTEEVGWENVVLANQLEKKVESGVGN
jgi:hypothetical protein